MIINKEILDYILHKVSKIPPEMGGILGSKNKIICQVELDKGIENNLLCNYVPDVDKLNRIIEKWQQADVLFEGIFHTHFYGVRTLSDGDKKYINVILNAMPENLDGLYFPIVLPETKQMIVYLAKRSEGKIEITEEMMEIR